MNQLQNNGSGEVENQIVSLDDAFSIAEEVQLPKIRPYTVAIPVEGGESELITFIDPFTQAGAYEFSDVITFVQEGLALDSIATKRAALEKSREAKERVKLNVFAEFQSRYNLNHVDYIARQWVGDEAWQKLLEAKKPTFQQCYALLLNAGTYYLTEAKKFGDLGNFTGSPTS